MNYKTSRISEGLKSSFT